MSVEERDAWAREVLALVRLGLVSLGLVPTEERVHLATASMIEVFRRYPGRHFPERDVNALVAASCLTTLEVERELARLLR